MCGICGIVRFRGSHPDPSEIGSMMHAIKHRGPNDEGKLIDGNLGLGFVRLSILDLSTSGRQPMYSADGRYAIIYNGEVYNYIELRAGLEKKGYRFRSGTDTEVVLNAFSEWGDECLNRFNGMWALVIYDRQKKELFCARDRYGVKPFYYYHDQNQFIFASEIQAILSVLDKKPGADHQTMFDYMVYNRTDQSDKTFYSGIKKLPHGSKMIVGLDSGDIRISTWYSLDARIKDSRPFRTKEEFLDTFTSAIQFRLRSDVPVGVCLSGGLDSSSIVSILLKQFNRDDLNTFSAVYEKGQKGDESDYINEYRPFIRNMHFVKPEADVFYADLQKFICTHAEPFPTTSIYAHYKVMEMAKQHVVVTLDGQGADEEMGGYHYFFGFYFKELLKKIRLIKLLTEAGAYWKNHHSMYGFKSMIYFMLPPGLKQRLRVREKGYLTREFANQEFHSVITNELYGSADLHSALLNHFEYKLEHLLKWQDLNSMRFSIEARVPFLDYRMVERLLKTESDRLISHGMTKYILRDAMEGILPDKIRLRKDKVGFETPQKEWFRTNGFPAFIKDIIHSASFRNRGIVDVEKAAKLLDDHLAGKKDISREIWKWINMELWFRKYMDA